jgi:hypothetical protein
MDYTIKLERCDRGCCFWIDGIAVKEGEFLDAITPPASGFLEEGKRGGATPPVIIVSCPKKRL